MTVDYRETFDLQEFILFYVDLAAFNADYAEIRRAQGMLCSFRTLALARLLTLDPMAAQSIQPESKSLGGDSLWVRRPPTTRCQSHSRAQPWRRRVFPQRAPWSQLLLASARRRIFMPTAQLHVRML